VPRFEERLVGDGDSVENWWDSSTIKSELLLVQMTMMNTKYRARQKNLMIFKLK